MCSVFTFFMIIFHFPFVIGWVLIVDVVSVMPECRVDKDCLQFPQFEQMPLSMVTISITMPNNNNNNGKRCTVLCTITTIINATERRMVFILRKEISSVVQPFSIWLCTQSVSLFMRVANLAVKVILLLVCTAGVFIAYCELYIIALNC